VDFPNWMVHSLDREAKKLGVTRQSIIKVWISERLKVKTACRNAGSNHAFQRAPLRGAAEGCRWATI
jgi:hypothetical protein